MGDHYYGKKSLTVTVPVTTNNPTGEVENSIELWGTDVVPNDPFPEDLQVLFNPNWGTSMFGRIPLFTDPALVNKILAALPDSVVPTGYHTNEGTHYGLNARLVVNGGVLLSDVPSTYIEHRAGVPRQSLSDWLATTRTGTKFHEYLRTYHCMLVKMGSGDDTWSIIGVELPNTGFSDRGRIFCVKDSDAGVSGAEHHRGSNIAFGYNTAGRNEWKAWKDNRNNDPGASLTPVDALVVPLSGLTATTPVTPEVPVTPPPTTVTLAAIAASIAAIAAAIV